MRLPRPGVSGAGPYLVRQRSLGLGRRHRATELDADVVDEVAAGSQQQRLPHGGACPRERCRRVPALHDGCTAAGFIRYSTPAGTGQMRAEDLVARSWARPDVSRLLRSRWVRRVASRSRGIPGTCSRSSGTAGCAIGARCAVGTSSVLSVALPDPVHDAEAPWSWLLLLSAAGREDVGRPTDLGEGPRWETAGTECCGRPVPHIAGRRSLGARHAQSTLVQTRVG